MGSDIPQILEKIYNNWQCFTLMYYGSWLGCCQWWCLLECCLYYKAPKRAGSLQLVMCFMSRVKAEGLIQTTDQQFSHWNKRTPEGFNPEGRWLITLECIPVFGHLKKSLLKGLGGCEDIQYSVLAHQLQQEGSEGSMMKV